MSAGIYNIPISLYQDGIHDGLYNMTPLVTFAHNTSSHTLKVYFGGFPNTALASATLYFESLDGTVTDNHALTLNNDLTSGTYTTTNTDAWLAAAGVTFKIWVVATLVASDVNINFPGGSTARQLVSSRRLQVTTT